MICYDCEKKVSIWIEKEEKFYCLDCGKNLLPQKPNKEGLITDYSVLLESVPGDKKLLVSSFDEEILDDLSESDWASPYILHYCMDRVLEKVFPELNLEDVTYQHSEREIEVIMPHYWQMKAKDSEEILEYVTCSINWKRRR